MRIAFLLALQVLTFGALLAQHGGMAFSESASWKEILAEAKASNRVIFMDAYTTWCGPCKMMAKNVFTDETVGDFYNANFVNVKMDMEAGEGVALASEYSVRAYPTLLFIDGDGAIVHRAVGYHEAAAFVELGKKSTRSFHAHFGPEGALCLWRPQPRISENLHRIALWRNG